MYDLNVYTLPTIDFVGGSTQELVFNVFFHKNNEPFDLVGYKANFSMMNYVNRGNVQVINKKMDILERHDGNNENRLRVVLEPTDTLNLSGKFIYQITIQEEESSAVDIPNQGIIYITNNISKSPTYS